MLQWMMTFDPNEQSYIDTENNELINLTLNVFLKKCEERIKSWSYWS
jgi:phage portal protein BeeE